MNKKSECSIECKCSTNFWQTIKKCTEHVGTKCTSVFKRLKHANQCKMLIAASYYLFKLTCGQSYKVSTIIVYDSEIVI